MPFAHGKYFSEVFFFAQFIYSLEEAKFGLIRNNLGKYESIHITCLETIHGGDELVVEHVTVLVHLELVGVVARGCLAVVTLNLGLGNIMFMIFVEKLMFFLK